MRAQPKKAQPPAAEPQPENHPAVTAGLTEIAPLAYQFWQDRGCPEGCPEEDWYRAEREIKQRRANAAQ